MQPRPDYRWQCHRCRTINDPGVEHCGACGFAAYATGYEILGQQDPWSVPIPESRELLIERIARVIHLVIGGLFLGAGGWSLFIADVQPLGFLGWPADWLRAVRHWHPGQQEDGV